MALSANANVRTARPAAGRKSVSANAILDDVFRIGCLGEKLVVIVVIVGSWGSILDDV